MGKELIIVCVLCLSASDVDAVLDLETCLPAAEQAFASYASGGSQVYPVVREQLPDTGGIFGIKSGYYPDRGWLGLKARGFWAENRRSGLARSGVKDKLDYLGPTGSFKDRGSTVLVSCLKELGVARAVEDSSGNAGASLAAYFAAAGIDGTIWRTGEPRTVPSGKE